MDQLHMHFTSAIHNTAFQIVLGYVELCSGTGRENFHKRQYTDLCKVRIISCWCSLLCWHKADELGACIPSHIFLYAKSTVYEKENSACIPVTHITTNCDIRHLHITKQFVFWIKCSCVSKSYMYCIIRKYFFFIRVLHKKVLHPVWLTWAKHYGRSWGAITRQYGGMRSMRRSLRRQKVCKD